MTYLFWFVGALASQLFAHNSFAAEKVNAKANEEVLIQMSNHDLVNSLTVQIKKRLGLSTTQIDELIKNGDVYLHKLNGLSEEKLTDSLNALIVESKIEGAEVINRHDPLFWLYRARFGLDNPPAPAMIPFWLTRRGHGWHVYLAATGDSSITTLMRGDQIEFSSGKPLSFDTIGAKTRSVKVKSLSWDKPETKSLPLQQKSVSQIFLDLVHSHRKDVVTGKTKTGVLPLPAIDLELLRVDAEQALKQFQNTTDQLIVDLRGPYGSGGMTGIELFLDDKGNRAHYKKPLYVLIDRYTSGGRELLAGLLQRHAGAILIGEETAGRTAPVELTELDPGKFILITEHQIKSAQSGPLKPDRPIAEALMFAAGQDKILEGAIEIISKK
jgi:hypothetical protein